MKLFCRIYGWLHLTQKIKNTVKTVKCYIRTYDITPSHACKNTSQKMYVTYQIIKVFYQLPMDFTKIHMNMTKRPGLAVHSIKYQQTRNKTVTFLHPCYLYKCSMWIWSGRTIHLLKKLSLSSLVLPMS